MTGVQTCALPILSLQKEISKRNLEEKIGKTYEVLIENMSFDKKHYIGRTYMDVPEEDGVVFIKNTKDLKIGEFVKCKIIEIRDYDLIGEIV